MFPARPRAQPRGRLGAALRSLWRYDSELVILCSVGAAIGGLYSGTLYGVWLGFGVGAWVAAAWWLAEPRLRK